MLRANAGRLIVETRSQSATLDPIVLDLVRKRVAGATQCFHRNLGNWEAFDPMRLALSPPRPTAPEEVPKPQISSKT